MSSPTEPLRVGVRNSRRIRGLLQTRNLEVSGDAPSAVVSAIRDAARKRPSPEEKAWTRRIELLRQLLLASPEPFDMTHLGRAADLGDGAPAETSLRTISHSASASKPPQWAYLLFRLVRALQPQRVLELGSCVGISAAYQAAALELNKDGRLLTLEGVVALAERSARTLEELQLDTRAAVRQGPFVETLPAAIRDLGSIDLAFIDGHHQEIPTLQYMEDILSSAAAESLLIFDDINWSEGMKRAWQKIVADERFALTVDLRSVGLAVVSASATSRQNLKIGYF